MTQTVQIQSCIAQSLFAIRRLFCREPLSGEVLESSGWSDERRPEDFTQNPEFQKQAGLAWLLAVEKNMPLVWFSKSRTASDLALNLLCLRSGFSLGRLLEAAEIRNADYARLMEECGRLETAPLKLCSVPHSREFMLEVYDLVVNGPHHFVMCDWAWQPDERQFIKTISPNAHAGFLRPNWK